MTAEIFLATFLGCLVAIIAIGVFFRTVYVPVQRYLSQRAWNRSLGNSAEFVSVGSSYIGPPGPGPDPTAGLMARYNASQELELAAIDIKDDLRTDHGESADRLIRAALAFRRTLTPRERKRMRSTESAVAAFHRAQQQPEDVDSE